MKFFFIKSKFKKVEQIYWLNEPDATDSIPLPKDKVAKEFITLGFYRLMGIPTPKTYLGEIKGDGVLISKLMKNWKSLRLSELVEETPSIPGDLEGSAELELASAVVSDIDVSGWIFDNIGKKTKQKSELLTKHDGGTHVLSTEESKFYSHFFELKKQEKDFPEGISTLSDDNLLNHTYLKIFLVDNLTHYNLHYKQLFKGITAEQRKKALIKLFSIRQDDLQLLVDKIPDDWLGKNKKIQIVEFLQARIATFKAKYQEHFKMHELNGEAVTTSPNYFFQKLVKQKHVIKKDWEKQFMIDPNYNDKSDWSQSQAGQVRFSKVPVPK